VIASFWTGPPPRSKGTGYLKVVLTTENQKEINARNNNQFHSANGLAGIGSGRALIARATRSSSAASLLKSQYGVCSELLTI
jgi:hypothetical protein